ncbi:MAG: hypothetical protein K9N23_14180 [Akkermansiaceae bacterium]|nr:hypothetical protein [Akkermansiaceae bacterium]
MRESNLGKASMRGLRFGEAPSDVNRGGCHDWIGLSQPQGKYFANAKLDISDQTKVWSLIKVGDELYGMFKG